MVVMQKNIIKVILFLFVLLGFCSCLMVNHSKREKMSYLIIALKQYRLYHSNDTALLAWLQVSLFTWSAIPV